MPVDRDGWYVVPITWKMVREDPAGVIRAIELAIERQTVVLQALGELH